MKTVSLSNLSRSEYNEVLAIWKKRRTIYLLLSLLIIPIPLTISFALFCNNSINYLVSGGRRTTNIIIVLLAVFVGAGFPIIIVPLLRFISPLGHLVLGTRVLE